MKVSGVHLKMNYTGIKKQTDLNPYENRKSADYFEIGG